MEVSIIVGDLNDFADLKVKEHAGDTGGLVFAAEGLDFVVNNLTKLLLLLFVIEAGHLVHLEFLLLNGHGLLLDRHGLLLLRVVRLLLHVRVLHVAVVHASSVHSASMHATVSSAVVSLATTVLVASALVASTAAAMHASLVVLVLTLEPRVELVGHSAEAAPHSVGICAHGGHHELGHVHKELRHHGLHVAHHVVDTFFLLLLLSLFLRLKVFDTDFLSPLSSSIELNKSLPSLVGVFETHEAEPSSLLYILSLLVGLVGSGDLSRKHSAKSGELGL